MLPTAEGCITSHGSLFFLPSMAMYHISWKNVQPIKGGIIGGTHKKEEKKNVDTLHFEETCDDHDDGRFIPLCTH